jgi:hypothetical protein
MLVCNVSMRPRGRAVAAELAESAVADDASSAGVLFPALVDDPASALDTVDAFFGDIMLEAASAADTVVGGFAYDAAVAETTTAISAEDGSVTTGPPPTTTWNPSDKTNITLSGSNLIATATAGNCWVRAIKGNSSGKYYFEIVPTSPSLNAYIGIATAAAAGSFTGVAVLGTNANIYVNSAGGVTNIGGAPSAHVIGIAVDLGTNQIWFKDITASGNWNGSSSANPASGAGGISISAISGGLLFPFAWIVNSGDTAVANFGASAFTGTTPSGFNAGWPA